MPTVRIWTLESENDRKVVKCLADKLVTHLKLGNLSIEASDNSALRRYQIKGASLSETLRRRVQAYLKEGAYVIFVIDRDGPMSSAKRRKEPNSLINQVEQVVNDSSLPAGKVFLVEAVHELEAWLLIDCLGIFHYFASQSPQHRTIDRDKVSITPAFAQLIRRYQKGDTEKIVEVEIGGRGPKEYLEDFSEKILLTLNPNMPLKNVKRQRYRAAISPEVAERMVINQDTLKRNKSLCKLGDKLAKVK